MKKKIPLGWFLVFTAALLVFSGRALTAVYFDMRAIKARNAKLVSPEQHAPASAAPIPASHIETKTAAYIGHVIATYGGSLQDVDAVIEEIEKSPTNGNQIILDWCDKKCPENRH